MGTKKVETETVEQRQPRLPENPHFSGDSHTPSRALQKAARDSTGGIIQQLKEEGPSWD